MTTAYNDTNFRAQFPAFANATTYPMAVLSSNWSMGTNYVSVNNGVCSWNVTASGQSQLANDLLCAHITYLFTNMANGQNVGVVTGAAEGSVNVTFMPPPAKGAFQFWLSTSPYGLQLRALLKAVAGVGLYVGGSPERQGYRKIGGVF